VGGCHKKTKASYNYLDSAEKGERKRDEAKKGNVWVDGTRAHRLKRRGRGARGEKSAAGTPDILKKELEEPKIWRQEPAGCGGVKERGGRAGR